MRFEQGLEILQQEETPLSPEQEQTLARIAESLVRGRSAVIQTEIPNLLQRLLVDGSFFQGAITTATSLHSMRSPIKLEIVDFSAMKSNDLKKVVEDQQKMTGYVDKIAEKLRKKKMEVTKYKNADPELVEKNSPKTIFIFNRTDLVRSYNRMSSLPNITDQHTALFIHEGSLDFGIAERTMSEGIFEAIGSSEAASYQL